MFCPPLIQPPRLNHPDLNKADEVIQENLGKPQCGQLPGYLKVSSKSGLNKSGCCYTDSEMHFTFVANTATTPETTSMDVQIRSTAWDKQVVARMLAFSLGFFLQWKHCLTGRRLELWVETDEKPKEPIVSCCFISALLLYLYSTSAQPERC